MTQLGPLVDPYVRVLDALASELDAVALPTGPARRSFEHPTTSLFEEVAREIRRDVEAVARAERWPTVAVQLQGPRAMAMAGILYAAGAPHPAWRRWLALAAASERLVGNWIEAVALGAVAGEWTFVERIDDTQERFDADAAAIWSLLGKRPTPNPADFAAQPGASSWSALAAAAAAGDDDGVERALIAVVDETMADDAWGAGTYVRTGDPGSDHFLPFMWFSHASRAWAAAAILRRQGFEPSERLGVARLRYLEPCLADGASSLGAERFLPRDP